MILDRQCCVHVHRLCKQLDTYPLIVHFYFPLSVHSYSNIYDHQYKIKKPIQHDLLNGLLIWFFEFHRSNLRFIVSGFVPVTLTYYFFGLYLLFWNIVSYYRRLHVISLVFTSLFLLCSETADQVFQ